MFAIAPVNGFCLVRDMPECTTEFSKKVSRIIPACCRLSKYNLVHRKETKNTKNVRKACY